VSGLISLAWNHADHLATGYSPQCSWPMPSLGPAQRLWSGLNICVKMCVNVFVHMSVQIFVNISVSICANICKEHIDTKLNWEKSFDVIIGMSKQNEIIIPFNNDVCMINRAPPTPPPRPRDPGINFSTTSLLKW
jgi:hypothetical protein